MLTYRCSVASEYERGQGTRRRSFGVSRGAYSFPCWGMMRRLRRGSGTCRPMGRSHFSFGGERKVCKRKPAARHSRGGPRRYAPWASVCGSPMGCPRPRFAALTRREKALIAHFDGGARNVAHNLVGELPPTFARAPVLPFFRRQNGRAFFPSLPNAALLPRSWHRADSNSGAWELQRSLAASQRRETELIFSFTVGARHA